jgi:hypothetical protein
MNYRLPLSTSTRMGINLERGRHVRMAELRLSHPQRSSLLVKQRSMPVPQGMPIDQSESRLLRSRMELASPQILGVEWPPCRVAKTSASAALFLQRMWCARNA